MKRRWWTEEEISYLEESVGRIKIPTIANKLNRTPKAVTLKMKKLGINNTKLESGMITANELATACNVDFNVVNGWMKAGLKSSPRVTRTSMRFYFIDIENFWDWAADNKSRIDFYKVDEYVLLPEPDWVEFQRKHDYHHVPRKRHAKWTEKEDSKLLQLLRTGMTRKEIGKELNRSVHAVTRRLYRLRNRRDIS